MAPKREQTKTHRIGESGYILPDHIPPGEIVHGLKNVEDMIQKNTWRIGRSIGVGGFGEIYLCSEDITRNVGNDATLAMKIEPHENGPLFVEMNFYIRAAKPQEVDDYRTRKGRTSLGMPVHRGYGSHIFKGDRYRFLVMDRLGKDLQKIFLSGKQTFPLQAAFNIAIKVLYSLEYIHSKGYVHNDIKAQNLLLGHGRTKENDLFLVDFGLVSKYHRGGVHLEYKPDERKAHDGTIEYTSRDAHIGAHSRRSDLEILGYNLVHWISGQLPWLDNLTDLQYVHNQKNGFMGDIPKFLMRCFGDDDYPSVLEEYLNYVVSMEFDTTPNYEKCREMFEQALKKGKFPINGKLDFSKPAQKCNKKKRKRKFSEVDQNFQYGMEDAPPRKSARVKRKEEEKERECNDNSNQTNENSTNSNIRAVSASSNRNYNANDKEYCGDEVDDSNLYGANTATVTSNMETWSWERVLCSDPELLLRQASRMSDSADANNPLAIEHKQLDEKQQKQSLKNPTPAMKAIIRKMEEREKEREQVAWQQQLQHFTNRNSNSKATGGQNKTRNDVWDLTPNVLTPAMEEVMRKRSNRVSVEFDVPITPDPSDSEEENSDSSSEIEINHRCIRDSKGKRILIFDDEDLIESSNSNKDEISNDDSESSFGSENDADIEDTESYINSSDEEDFVMFPSSSQYSIDEKTDRHHKENELSKDTERNEDTGKNGEELNRNQEPQVPTINVLPELSLNSRNINPPIENRQGSISSDDSHAMFTQTQKPKLDISLDSDTMFTQAQKPKLDDISLDSDTMFTQENKGDSELEMFSSQCESSQKEREKDLDMQFDKKSVRLPPKARAEARQLNRVLDDSLKDQSGKLKKALFNSPDKRDVHAPIAKPKRQRKFLDTNHTDKKKQVSDMPNTIASTENSVIDVRQETLADKSEPKSHNSRNSKKTVIDEKLATKRAKLIRPKLSKCSTTKGNEKSKGPSKKIVKHKECNLELEKDSETDLHSSMERIISSVSDSYTDSRMSNASQNSSNSLDGGKSRVTIRSSSTASLPSSSHTPIVHKKIQRRRISIQNVVPDVEDSPYMKNKDNVAKQGKPRSFKTNERKLQTLGHKVGVNCDIDPQVEEPIESKRGPYLVQNEQNEYEDIATESDSSRIWPDVKQSVARKQKALKRKSVLPNNKAGISKGKSLRTKQSHAFNRKIEMSRASKLKKILTPRNIKKNTEKKGSIKSPFFTPIANRLKSKFNKNLNNDLQMKISNNPDKISDSIQNVNSPGVLNFLHDSKSRADSFNKVDKFSTHKQILHKDSCETTKDNPQEPVPSTSHSAYKKMAGSDLTKKSIFSAKSPSFVTKVFAAKNSVTKPSPCRKTANLKGLSANPDRPKDDLVTRCLKRFKQQCSPKIPRNDSLEKHLKLSDNTSKLSTKGKGVGKKSCNANPSFTEKDFISTNEDATKKISTVNNKTNRKFKKPPRNDEDIFKRPTPLNQQKETNRGNNPKIKKKNFKLATKADSDEKKVLRSSRR